MDAMGRPLTQNDITDFFETDSTNPHKKIDFSEFLSIMTSAYGASFFVEFMFSLSPSIKMRTLITDPISDHEMKGIFNEFDLNHDGEITFQGLSTADFYFGKKNILELKNVMISIGEDLSDDDVNEMIKEADPNKRGRVTYNVYMHITCARYQYFMIYYFI